jgi:hypothetical protein
MKTDLTYSPPDAKDAGGLPFKIEGGKITTSEAKGTIYFDAEKGRVVKTEMDIGIKGTLQISVADQKADVELDQKQKTTTAISDKNPNEATAAAPPAPSK